MLKGAGMDGLEISLPRQQLASESSPELVRLRNRLLVELLIFFEARDMRLSRVFPANSFCISARAWWKLPHVSAGHSPQQSFWGVIGWHLVCLYHNWLYVTFRHGELSRSNFTAYL